MFTIFLWLVLQVQREVRDPLTDEILFGKLENGGNVTIGVANEKLTFAYDAKQA